MSVLLKTVFCFSVFLIASNIKCIIFDITLYFDNAISCNTKATTAKKAYNTYKYCIIVEVITKKTFTVLNYITFTSLTQYYVLHHNTPLIVFKT